MVILRNVPDQKLQLLRISTNQLLPRKTRIVRFLYVLNTTVKDEFHQLLLVINRNLVNLQLNRTVVVQTLTDKLKVSN